MYPGFFPFACLLIGLYAMFASSRTFYAILWVTVVLTAVSAVYYSSADLPLLRTYHW